MKTQYHAAGVVGNDPGIQLGSAGSTPARRSFQQDVLFDERPAGHLHCLGRREVEPIICRYHYMGSFPTGWTACYRLDGAVVVFSIPANQHLEPFLFDRPVGLRELARLWAPDGHEPNLLTRAIAAAVRALRDDHGARAVVSFADPNAGHHGGVYQAASWIYTGQSSETRAYMHDGSPSRAARIPLWQYVLSTNPSRISLARQAPLRPCVGPSGSPSPALRALSLSEWGKTAPEVG